MEALGVKNAVIIGKLDLSLSGFTMKKLEKEYNAYLEAKDNDEIKNKFKVLAEAVSA